ncbi:MAG: hypothetical protein AB8B50_02090 [Pirellulaceae bacterium]
MRNLAAKLKLILTIRCEQASQLTSESLDRELDSHERIAVRFHQAVCWSCRKFEEQLHLLRAVMRKSKEQEFEELTQGPSLPEESKQRLRNLL